MTTPIAVTPAALPGSGRLIASRTLSGLAGLFLAFDAVLKLMLHPAAVETTAQLGFPPSVLPTLGALQLVCLVLYFVPRTAVLGAILWTGYLCGAVATHVRAGSPLFTHTLFPVWIGFLLWSGLALRNRRLLDVLGGRS